ncbi:MAG: cob(I)yrinic acid a,c-diamide adenosyltransferase [Candidatus Zixiibacteriota bacterium]|nr:MAG: cob(I)yrinic acid a,c-diamide adenosyltransferase [candidate division Zixibacteria bacterium]
MDARENKQKEKGLLIVYTGHGKGKTTAALGMTIRALGYGWQVCIIQFIKGSWKYGEMDGIKKLAPNVELNIMGEGFVGIIDDNKSFEEHRAAARKAYDLALEKMQSGKYNLVILDELNVAVSLGLITRDELQELVGKKPEQLHLVITGRDATEWLIGQADLVTEMKEIKHPYQKGILAQKGVDY